MEPKQRNKIFKINNSNYSSDRRNIYPSNYIKDKYPHLNEVVPKNSILFKVKYKPDNIIISQYNQTSNNINANIKIKANPSLENIKADNNQRNFMPQNNYYSEFTNNTLLNYLDENDINNISGPKYIEESPIRLSEHKLVNNDNSFQNFLIERNNLNNEFFINPIVLNEKSQIEKKNV